MKFPHRILGISASLRNARFGVGNRDLVESLARLDTEDELLSYLTAQSEMHLENFIEAGRREGKPFDEIYANLKKGAGKKGLSNSEVALASALWAAKQTDPSCEIDHISLSEYFSSSGQIRMLDKLKEKLLSADGILISSPVYFGDRSSLVQSLVDLIKTSPDLRNGLGNKVYGGIAVGAKRNGGQETTLIFQMADFARLGLLAVGNDSDTTAQYGGTGHAGDIGTMHRDNYGLKTSMGTGRRVARLTAALAQRRKLRSPVRVLFIILQDHSGIASSLVSRMIADVGSELSASILDLSKERILPCIACDICPTHIDSDDAYRCIITSKHDALQAKHHDLLYHDAIIPVMLSLSDGKHLDSNYQSFIERTRYLRRGDYVLSNQLVAPMIIEEIGASEHYAMRLMTSMVRHHTVMTKPIRSYLQNGALLNEADATKIFSNFLISARLLAAARLSEIEEPTEHRYHPVGYILSTNKDAEDQRLNTREHMVQTRYERLCIEAKERLESISCAENQDL